MSIILELKNKLQKQKIGLNRPATWQEVLAFEYVVRGRFRKIKNTPEMPLHVVTLEP